MKYLALVIAVLVSTGCAQVSQGGYYWGQYSESYFALVKDRNQETVMQRITALEEIVSESASRDIRVPPGIHAELGMVYAEVGREEESLGQFETEVAIYPESKPFIERLVSRQ